MWTLFTGLLLPVLSVLGQNIGQWSSPIQFPIVPVAAAVNPSTGELMTWSAYATDRFSINVQNITQTAIWNPNTNAVRQATVYQGHDMFCPGISFDFSGNLIVTGGDTAPATSVLQGSTTTWKKGPSMKVPRGYQASATLSDGRIFTIGGSWSGNGGTKNGEVYDGTKWTLLSGCKVSAMLTQDPQGIFRSDNHASLFGWKSGSVFQAGPSKAMNWYYTSNGGSFAAAGTRGTDPDAMCGTSTMYDAVAGKILAAGGSSAYQDRLATSNANVITIGNPGSTAQVSSVSSMAYPRIFASGTVLPDGTVLVTGGQSYGVPFSDANATKVPELFDPVSSTWTQLRTQSTPRTYHSVAVLLADGRVFSGGGGLCGTCSTNHFDGEIFSPPYLYQSDGTTLATRPGINSISATTLKVGASFSVTVNSGSGTMKFSLVRYGSSTHTVNTDQRRVPLTGTASGSTYSFTLPSDPGVLLPGYWYFFALRDGVPSTARTVKITL